MLHILEAAVDILTNFHNVNLCADLIAALELAIKFTGTAQVFLGKKFNLVGFVNMLMSIWFKILKSDQFKFLFGYLNIVFINLR